jgi:predicted nucleotidyltransferase
MSTEKIYDAFFNSNSEELYYNQLKELTKLSYSSLQNSLKKLLLNKEIIKNKTKSNVYYKLSYLKPVMFTKITLKKINELNRDVRIPLKEFIEEVPKTVHSIIFFGSASKKQEQEGSDIDLLIILDSFEKKELQELYEEEIRSKIKKINISTIYNFSLAYITKKDFQKQEDFLIKEAKQTGFPIVNQQRYYEELQ